MTTSLCRFPIKADVAFISLHGYSGILDFITFFLLNVICRHIIHATYSASLALKNFCCTKYTNNFPFSREKVVRDTYM
jgi:hypothetical protein